MIAKAAEKEAGAAAGGAPPSSRRVVIENGARFDHILGLLPLETDPRQFATPPGWAPRHVLEAQGTLY